MTLFPHWFDVCRVRALSFFGLLLALLSAPALAQSYRHSALIDSDNDAGTGCTVNSAAGSVSGIELMLTADVSGTPPQVDAVSQQLCSGAAFDPPTPLGGGYPVALNSGIGGADAIELALPYLNIPQPTALDWRIAFLSESSLGADLLGPFTAAGLGSAPPPPATPSPDLIPTLSPGGLIGLSVAMAVLLLWGARRHRGLLSVVLLCGSLSFFGVAWAANYMADGNLGDWAGDTPNATDPSGDTSSGEDTIDLVAGFVRREGGNVFFRLDVVDAEASNHAPIIADQNFSIDENSANASAVGTVIASDSDAGDTLTYAITAGNGSGTFAIDANSGAISIADNTALDYETTTSFALTVEVTDDGIPNISSSATITVNLNDVNEAPTAAADSDSTDEDTALNVAAPGVLGNDSDPDGDVLTAVLDTDVSNGTLVLNADGSFSYTPDAGYNGMDSFSYHANDGALDSTTATVNIAVALVNDDPVATDDSYSTDEDTPLSVPAAGVLANDTDADGDPLTAVLDTDVSNGTLTLNADGSFSYTPDADFNGSDSFSYHANDGVADSNIATVSITVNAVNDAPVAVVDNFATDEDTALNVPAAGVLINDSDVENDLLTAVLDTDVSNGTLTLNANGSFSYTPDPDFDGTDSFSYHANDGTADSNVVTVTITVGPVNDGPTAVNDSFATDEDTLLNVAAPGLLGNDTDPDGDMLAVTAFDAISTQGAMVTVNADGSFSYDPTGSAALQALEVGESVPDSFTYTVEDPGSDSDTATVTITVTGVDDPPVAVDDSATVAEDSGANAIDVLANDTDPDGGAINIISVSNPANGTATITGGGTGVTYQPDPDYCNDGVTTDTFTYTLSPGGSTATVSMTVTCVNDAPIVTAPGPFNVTGNVRIQVPDGASDLLAGASDPDGGSVSIGGTVPTTTAQGGNLSINTSTGSFSYNPPAGYEGPDSFIYEVCDSSAACANATVNLTVSGMVWFVSPAAGAGDGRLATPFNDIDALDAINNGTGNNPAAGDDIFLYSGTHNSSLTLLDDQRVFGQGATAALAALTGITLPMFSDAFPVTGGARPVWNANNADAVTLGSNNTLRGFDIGDTGTGTGVFGMTFGLLTMSEVRIGGSGQAMTLSSGNAAVVLDDLDTTSSPAQGLYMGGVGGSFEVVDPMSISGITDYGLRLENVNATMTFGDANITVPGLNRGVHLAGGTGVATFGDVVMSNGAGAFGLSMLGKNAGSVSLDSLTVSGAGTGIAVNSSSAPLTISGGSLTGTPVSIVSSSLVADITSTINMPSGGTAFGISQTGGGSVDLRGSIAGGGVVVQNGTAGSIEVHSNLAISGTPSTGISVQNNSGGMIVFSGASKVISTGAVAAVSLGSNTGASIDFINGGLDIDTTSGAGFNATGGGTVTVSGVGNSVTAATGTAVNLINTTIGGSGISFDSVTANGAVDGINLTNVGSGNFAALGGSIQSVTDRGVDVSGGSGNIIIGASISTTATGRSVEVTTHTGGTVDFNGLIDDNGLGIRLENNVGSVLRFDGGMDVDTAATSGTEEGFQAAGGGTLHVTGTNDVNTSLATGTAVNIAAGTTIGSDGVTFRNVSADGATTGVLLDSIGSNGFTITGDGPNGSDGSGGTIQNITQRGVSVLNSFNITLRNIDLNNVATTDAPANCDGLVNSGCHAGVNLYSVVQVVLDNVDVNGSGQIGINGASVSFLTLVNSDVRNCGDEVNEGCLQVFGLSAASAITDSTIALPSERAAYINNNNTPFLSLTVSGSTFSDTQSSPFGADGLELNFTGASDGNVDIVDSSFLRNRTNGLQTLAQGTSIVLVDVTGSTFDREAGIGIGIDLAASDSARLDFNVIGNPLINSREGPAINVFADSTAFIEGRINNNPDIRAGGAGTAGFGISVQTNESAQGHVEIINNVVSDIGLDAGIRTIARGLAGAPCGTGCSAGRLDATISNNSVTVAPAALYDIWVQANDSNTICANVGNNNASGGAIVAFRERTNAASSTALLQGFMTDAATTWNNAGNTPANSVSASNNGTLQGGTCSIPANPLP